MTSPVADVALGYESVKLLRAGDVLEAKQDFAPHLTEGKTYTFRERDTHGWIGIEADDIKSATFWTPRNFVFASRPDVPALTDGEGPRERLLADLDALCDGELNSTPVRTWGDSGDGAYVRYIGDIGRDLRALLNGADR